MNPSSKTLTRASAPSRAFTARDASRVARVDVVASPRARRLARARVCGPWDRCTAGARDDVASRRDAAIVATRTRRATG